MIVNNNQQTNQTNINMNKHIVILTNADIEEHFGPVYVFDDEQSASNFQRQVLDHIRDGERRSGVDSEYWPIIKRATPVTISPLPPAPRCVVVEHNIVVTATGEALPAKVCDGGLWGDDFDNLASSNPEDPFIYKDVEGSTLPPEPYGRPVTFTQVFLRTTKTDEQLLQEYK